MRPVRGRMIPLVIVAALAATAGCKQSIEMTYSPALYRLDRADALRGIALGVAKLEDRRPSIERNDLESLSFFMSQGPWRFGLTFQGKEYTPVADVVQSVFVDEFTRAGIETKTIPQILTKDAIPAMREAGEKAGVAYVLGGRVLVFEAVNQDKFWTIESRRSIILEINVVRVATGDISLDTTVSQTNQKDEGMGIRHTTNVDRLMNTVFRQVVVQVVEQVAAKLAMDPRDIDVRVSLVLW
jgi:hypothetical protein